MSKKNNKEKKIFNETYKKDTLGLFDGNFKKQVFDTEVEKENRRRKSTKDWLDYSEEEELDEYDY